MNFSRNTLREMIREELERVIEVSNPDKTYEPPSPKSLMLDRPTQHGGWPEGEYDPPVNKQILDWLKDMGLA